jgi:Leucine-rich repeat (LRR) protein
MGKTTFSLNLYTKYNSFFRELLNSNKHKMSLIPLGYEDADVYIQKLKEDDGHLDTILILDALDEDKNAIIDSKKRLEEIIDTTKDFRFVILTCRTQFFNNESLEPNEINVPRLGTRKGFYSFEKLYLSPFTDRDVKWFIFKKYGFLKYFSKEKKKAYKIISKSPYLMARPMLLDFIQDIAKTEKKFDYTFEIYEELINSWLNREVLNVPINKKYSYKNDLIKFSSELAKVIYDKRMQTGYTISLTKFEIIAKENNLDLTFFEMKTRSLLNRNPSGDYKFSHKSILEYFLALQLFKDISYKKSFEEEGMDMTIDFYNELCYVGNYLPYIKSANYRNNIKLIGNSKFNPKKEDYNNCLKVIKLEVKDINEDNFRAFRAYKNINELTIINSDISSLDDINCFQNLKILKIINCKVGDLKRISDLKEIEYLMLKNIKLLEYQKNEINWKELKNLSVLDLSENSINSFNQIKDLNYLKTLDLSDNNISDFVVTKTLKNLNISSNQLKVLELFDLQLTKLNVSKNKLTTFSMEKMNALSEINISYNKLEEITSGENSSVTVLNASNNLFKKGIGGLKHYQNIKYLDISSNNITNLSSVKNLNNLIELNIANTLIPEIVSKDIPNNLKTIIISKIEISDNIKAKFRMEDNKTKLIKIT